MSRLRTWTLAFLALLPWAVGWLVGMVIRCGLWIVACVLAGYAAGRGAE